MVLGGMGGPAPQMPPRGMPPRGMPPRGDTGTNIQKVDYAAQNAAGPGKLGNYGPPPNLPAQMPIQAQSNMSAAPPGRVPQVMPPTVTGDQAKSMGLGAAMGSNPQQGMGQAVNNFGQAATGMGQSVGIKKGGKVSSASSRADGCAVKGKTKGRFV